MGISTAGFCHTIVFTCTLYQYVRVAKVHVHLYTTNASSHLFNKQDIKTFSLRKLVVYRI